MKYKINQTLRNQAFYLIKKYTSYRFLYTAFQLNKEFVDAVEEQLRKPSLVAVDQMTEYEQQMHESELIYYLDILSKKEKGFLDLYKTPFKSEAYYLICKGGFISKIFGRYGDEQGLIYDIFYQNLGLRNSNGHIYDSNQQEKYIKKILDAGKVWDIAGITLFDGEYNIPNKYEPIYIKWSYESLFSENYWPLVKDIVEPIEICPIYNENLEHEIATGKAIEISGIYEPWFDQPVYKKLTDDPNYNPHVGCPNYFLNGAIATQYKLEGTEDWYNVKWRLIWEDKRYLDGTIPEEEKAYIFDLENICVNTTQHYATQKLSVLGGLPCPKEGYWYTLAQEKSHRYFKQGEIFPEIANSAWGETIWYLEVMNKNNVAI